MNSSEIIKLYNRGDYLMCVQVLCDDKEKLADVKDNIKITNICQTSRKFLFQSNTLICQAIRELSRNKNAWSNSMNNLLKLHSSYKSLTLLPLELELNGIYNILWWYWFKPPQLRKVSLHLKHIIKSVSSSLIKVLRSNGEVVLGQELCLNDTSTVVHLLKRASDHLLSLNSVACMQLIDIITIMVQIFFDEPLKETENLFDCMYMMKKTIDQDDLLRLHFSQGSSTGDEELYFKFGMERINSTASLKNCSNSIDMFIITGSLICTINREYDLAVQCLKKISQEGKTFKFMANYLKGYCFLAKQHYNEAKLCLAYVMSSPLPDWQMAHYRLLLAQLLSAQGDHQAALGQCDTILASNPGPYVATRAAHTAALEAQKLNLANAQLKYLQQLVQYLKKNLCVESVQFSSFEDHCLLVLSQKFSISLPSTLYMLARQLYISGYHDKAVSSYNDLLEEVKSSLLCETILLPCKPQIIQESALAHFRTSSYQVGEKLCRELIRSHFPHLRNSHSIQSEWELALYKQDEDILALILLADILAISDRKKAIDQLNRCYNVLNEWYETVTSEIEKQLCGWFLSRVLLRKARSSEVKEAAHYFHRALQHKPGDKEVMFYYKQWALWHPDHESFDPGDNVVLFPVHEVQNLLFRHLLSCSFSDEEWGALFDHQSSQNIIDSLFEDDG